MGDQAYVWISLPGRTEPVVAGRIFRDRQRLLFNYGRSYLARSNAMPLFLPELPLVVGAITPLPGLSMPSSLRDAAPDAWGRRVILNRLRGRQARERDVDWIDELSYLLVAICSRAVRTAPARGISRPRRPTMSHDPRPARRWRS